MLGRAAHGRSAAEQATEQAAQTGVCTGTAAQQTTEQPTESAAHTALRCAATLPSHRALAGTQELFEQIAGVHDGVLIGGSYPVRQQ
jgi:hypothetical protein